jgi:hypothetical protein
MGASKSLEAKVECRTSTGWKQARALIDLDAELNLVLQLFMKEVGWQLQPDSAPPVKSIDGRYVIAYGTLRIATNITDRDKKCRKQQDDYVSTDISGYDLILGDPWLQTRNLDIDWEARAWRYTEHSKPLEILAARAFFSAA